MTTVDFVSEVMTKKLKGKVVSIVQSNNVVIDGKLTEIERNSNGVNGNLDYCSILQDVSHFRTKKPVTEARVYIKNIVRIYGY